MVSIAKKKKKLPESDFSEIKVDIDYKFKLPVVEILNICFYFNILLLLIKSAKLVLVK